MFKPFKEGGDAAVVTRNLEACPELLSAKTSRLSMAASTPLHMACKNQQVEAVRSTLAFLSNADIATVRDALRPYCRRVHQPLPETPADGIRVAVNMINARSQTPLMYACYTGCADLVRLLLVHGADPWIGDRHGFRTPLHYTAAFGNAACVRALFDNIPASLMTRRGKRYIDAQAMYGMTPLHYSVYFGDLDVLRELLRHGPELNAPTTSDVFVTCDMASTPLHFAAVRGDIAAARELLQYYARRMVSDPGSVADPRTRPNAKSQLPWQVAILYHRENMELAELLHPGQTIHEALGGRRGGFMAARTSEPWVGPPSLMDIAAAALKAKLVADISRIEGNGCAAAALAAVLEGAGQEQRAERVQVPADGAGQEEVREEVAAMKAAVREAATAAATSSKKPARAAARSALAKKGSGNVSDCSGSGDGGGDGGGGGGGGGGDGRGGGAGGGGAVAGTADTVGAAGCSAVPPVGREDTSGTGAVGGVELDGFAVRVRSDSQGDDGEEVCELCFAAAPAVAPASCGHGVCGGCAVRLCGAMRTQPLVCPFCRKSVTGFAAYERR